MEVEGREARSHGGMAWWGQDDTWITFETFASLLC